MSRYPSLQLACLAAMMLVTGCGDDTKPAAKTGGEAHAPAPSNRIDIPPAVRTNLGITFAKVESRRVAATRRYPGRFELPPQARRHYHAMLPGRVELAVAQYQQVRPGQVLFRVDSPSWREMQEKLVGDIVAMQGAVKRIEASDLRAKAVAEHEQRVDELIAIWRKRLDELAKLAEAGGGAAAEIAEARGRLADALTEDAKVHEEEAELNESRAQLEAELARYRQSMPRLFAQATGQAADREARASDVTLARLASLTGLTPDELMAADNAGLARWRTLGTIEVKATHPGIVESVALTSGTWAETGANVLSIIDPADVRFRAVAPQSDLALLTSEAQGKVLPPRAGAAGGDPAVVTLTLGLEADPDQRTIEVIASPTGASRPAWARAGVSSQLEIVTAGGEKEDLAIPAAAVIQDGLERIIFRRDPRDPDKVIRMPADLGLSDGQWTVVASGVREGDEVVLEGVYELKLASSSTGQLKGGHFHADGTWHADGTPEPGEK